MAVRVHGHHGGKVLHLQFPNRLRRTKFFEQINIADFLDALGQYLRRAANRVASVEAAIGLAADLLDRER